jgi:hypothetical protein
MGQWFTLPTERGYMKCFSCAPYYPYRLSGQLNPQFDKHSGLILTSKSAQESRFGDAIRYFSKQLEPEIRTWNLQQLLPIGTDLRMLENRPYVDVILVPSSKAGKVSDGLTQVMQKVCATDRRLSLIEKALVRTRDVKKLAAGGNRDKNVHEESIQFRPPKNSSHLIVLIDDVCTSGNSLVACCNIIQNQLPSVIVIGVVLGRTTHD